MTADIIPFVPRHKRKREFLDVYVLKAAPDDLVMDHIDTSPCEYVWPDADGAAPVGNLDVQI